MIGGAAPCRPPTIRAGRTGPATGRSSIIYGNLEIRRARVNNLRNVSLDIPKQKITVFTGASGSGKSSLAFGTIAAESQRLINETYPAHVQAALPKYGQPDADSIAGLSAAIVVDQQRMGGNARSTVGTATDAYTLLRLLYSRVGRPAVSHPKKLSFNDPQGMCEECEGLGRAAAVDIDALVDRDRSLNEGAFRFPTLEPGSAHWNFFVSSGFFDNDKKLADYDDEEWDLLLNGPSRKVSIERGDKVSNFTYEGLLPKFRRLWMAKGADRIAARLREPYERVVTTGRCMSCGGTRLNPEALACRVDGKNIGECMAMEVADLSRFVAAVEEPEVAPVVSALTHRLGGLTGIGLGYLSLDRESVTLSGGESQRVKMVRHLGSSLTDMTYVFDEPTAGLHPFDVHRLNELLVRLRDKGNTVLVVEHKPEVMEIADHVVDLGPGAGRDGGEIVYQGDFAGLRASCTLTGGHLDRHQRIKDEPREPRGWLRIERARLHNLKDVTVDVPEGVLTVVTGVAGAGKSALIQGCLPRHRPDAVFIDQSIPRGSRRSTPATYTGMLDPVRTAFAKVNRVDRALFSANSEGACPDCQGLGVIYTDLAHLDPVVTTCDSCDGRRFNDEVLGYRLRGRDISQVLEMTAAEAADFFTEPDITAPLRRLIDVGLGYVTLSQPVSTLSGGERQRLKLANELGKSGRLYVLDEPTTGLHMNDVDQLIDLFDRLVDGGSTVIVIEHDLDVVSRADWIIDLGPGPGHEGGNVVFTGPPTALLDAQDSVTAEYLRRRVASRVG
ncbi:excinuclease ABC subunit UvrA [Actinoallomurus sp. NPDC050550]|uniref:excinuclease ABC subunit UvrA n=1 Tax=Actinoallomurus sp. NPDC050550 TaxID=3154937 RepID=UPI0033C0A52F